MIEPLILYIKNHYLTINGTKIFSHKFIAFTEVKELLRFKRTYKYSYNSFSNKMKTYKDLSKLFQSYTTGTSICNEKEFNWIRGLSNIKNDIDGNYIYIDCQW